MPSRRSPRKAAAATDGEMMGASRPSKSDGAPDGAPSSPQAKAAPTPSRPTPRFPGRRKKRDAGGVQLFAFPSPPESTAADSTADPSTPGVAASEAIPLRPKRKLKSIARYSDSNPHAQPPKGGECATYKHGEGFLCPRCGNVCSYDSRACEACHLECCYEAGVGVVTLRERRANGPEVKTQSEAGRRKEVGKGDGRGEKRGVKRGRPRGRPPKTNDGGRGENKAATQPGKTGRPRGRPPKSKRQDKHRQSPGPGSPGETTSGKKRARGRGVKPPPDVGGPPSSEGWVGVGVVPLAASPFERGRTPANAAAPSVVAADGGDRGETRLEGLRSAEAASPPNGEMDMDMGEADLDPRGTEKGPKAVAQDREAAYRTSTAGSDVEKTGGEGEEGAAPSQERARPGETRGSDGSAPALGALGEADGEAAPSPAQMDQGASSEKAEPRSEARSRAQDMNGNEVDGARDAPPTSSHDEGESEAAGKGRNAGNVDEGVPLNLAPVALNNGSASDHRSNEGRSTTAWASLLDIGGEGDLQCAAFRSNKGVPLSASEGGDDEEAVTPRTSHGSSTAVVTPEGAAASPEDSNETGVTLVPPPPLAGAGNADRREPPVAEEASTDENAHEAGRLPAPLVTPEGADEEDSHEGLVAVASTAKGAAPDESSIPGLDAGPSAATALTPENVDMGALPAKPPDVAKPNADATSTSLRKNGSPQGRKSNDSSDDESSASNERLKPKRAAPRSPFWKGTNPRGRPSRQVAELRERLRAATESNLALTERVERLQEGADAKVPGEASEADAAHRALRSTVHDCRAQIADLASAIRDKEQEISSAKATHASLEGRIASLNDDLSSVRAERDRLAKVRGAGGHSNHRDGSPPHHLHVPGDVSNCSTEAVEELQSKLEERAEEHARELAHVQGEKDELRAQLGDAQKKLTKRERELAASGEREARHRKKVARLEGMADVLMGQRDRASARVRQMLLSGSGGGAPSGPEAAGGAGAPTATERAPASSQSESEALAARLRASLAEIAALKSQKAAAVAPTAALERALEKRPEPEGPAAPMGAYRDKDGALESLSESSAGAEATSKRNEPFAAAAATLDVPSLSEAEAEADGEKTRVGELTDALGSLNDFENFLQDLGLSEDEHGSRLGL